MLDLGPDAQERQRLGREKRRRAAAWNRYHPRILIALAAARRRHPGGEPIIGDADARRQAEPVEELDETIAVAAATRLDRDLAVHREVRAAHADPAADIDELGRAEQHVGDRTRGLALELRIDRDDPELGGQQPRGRRGHAEAHPEGPGRPRAGDDDGTTQGRTLLRATRPDHADGRAAQRGVDCG